MFGKYSKLKFFFSILFEIKQFIKIYLNIQKISCATKHSYMHKFREQGYSY